jgi:hypothetical protein
MASTKQKIWTLKGWLKQIEADKSRTRKYKAKR